MLHFNRMAITPQREKPEGHGADLAKHSSKKRKLSVPGSTKATRNKSFTTAADDAIGSKITSSLANSEQSKPSAVTPGRNSADSSIDVPVATPGSVKIAGSRARQMDLGSTVHTSPASVYFSLDDTSPSNAKKEGVTDTNMDPLPRPGLMNGESGASPTRQKLMTNRSLIITSESEDEGPEDISATTARENMKAGRLRSDDAFKRQQQTAKLKRVKHDKLLKEQAKHSGKRRESRDKPSSHTEGADEPDNDLNLSPQAETEARSKRLAIQDVPDLLPVEYLAVERKAEEAEGTSPRVVPRQRNIARLLDSQRAMRDVKHGSLTFRVLPSPKTLTMPKVNKQSKMLRDSWMKGRSNRRGEPSVPRRRWVTDFLVT